MNGISGILANRGNGPDGQPYLLENVTVSSNTVNQNTGMAAGIVIAGSGFDNSVYKSWNNTYRDNSFALTAPDGNYFYWMGQSISLASFRSYL